jgi:hypothetical protein
MRGAPGHGQDHCELVNPAFTIPNEDITSGGCTSCSVGGVVDVMDVPVFARAVRPAIPAGDVAVLGGPDYDVLCLRRHDSLAPSSSQM